MTLEDFFTLTEMKDGFTAPARVEELIAVMQKEKDSLLKSSGDATRHWAAVASTIAATENKECLDLFIKLDGLVFIDRWLKDALAFPDEASDCFVDDAISALLRAVEKLQVDSDKLNSSGICITVKSLLNYKSITVQDKARALFDSWKAKDLDFSSVDVEKAPVNDDPKLDTQDPESQSAAKDASLVKSSGGQKLEGEGGQNKLSNDLDNSQIKSSNEDPGDGCADRVASPAKLESTADDPVIEEVCPSENISDSDGVTASKQGSDVVISETLKPVPLVEDAKHDYLVAMLPEADNSDNMDGTSVSAVSDNKNLSLRADAEEAAEEVVLKPDMEAYDVNVESQLKTATACETSRPLGESSDGMDGSEQKDLEKVDSSALVECKDEGATISTLEDNDHKEFNRYRKSERRYLGSSCGFTRLKKNSKTNDIIQQTRDMDLEDGTVDALEVARLVAKEVEREVVGYYEQSCSSASNSSSSSAKISSGGIRQHDSPKPVEREQDMEIDGPVKQLSPGEEAPDTSGKAPVSSVANLESTKNHTQDLDSSLVTDAAPEPERNTEKSLWEFDLNQEFSSEDANHQLDTSSNPVSVVSASRAVVESEMPAGPRQFEGSLGWKGSAATSAFRPASPRRASDSGGATSSGSRQRQDYLDFDLNVAEGVGDDKIVNPVLSKQSLMLASHPSGESSVELSRKRSQMLKLDLNQTEDDGVLPASEWKMGVQLSQPQNCHRSPSPASSSSCMQSSMRNFDLNDNPLNCNDLSDQPTSVRESYRKVNSCMGPPDDTVISILGTKVKKNTFPQTPLPFLNGRAPEPVMDANLFRGGPLMGLGSAVPYPQSAFGYNGLAMGAAVSLSSAQSYRPGGPIPYVFDSRGAPFLPQMLGSASSVPPSYCPSPLVVNMMGATPGPNLSGSLRPNLDLNSGFANAVEAGNPDPPFFRPLFIPHGQGRPSEEQLRDGFRALSSGGSGGKRKEPDGGWEFYPTNYEHQQPPHL